MFVIAVSNITSLNAVSDFYSENNIQFYDPSACDPNGETDETTDSSGVVEGPVYMLGDSITDGAKSNLNSEFSKASLDVKKINADVGRAISRDTVGSNPSGLTTVDSDRDDIKDSKTVVVALGTNSGGGVDNLDEDIPKLLDKIKVANSSAKIYWVNVFSEGANREDVNKKISNNSSKGYTVINTVGKGIDLSSDGTHPNTSGNKKFAEIVVNGVKSTTTNISSSTGVTFTTEMNVNTDGSGQSHGNRYHQNQTSFTNGGRPLNADDLNFIALSPPWASGKGLKLGDLALIEYKGKKIFAIYGDNWNDSGQVHGEGSYRMIQILSDNKNPNINVAIPPPVKYTVYPGSNKKLPTSFDQAKIDELGAQVSGVSGDTETTNSCCPADNSPQNAAASSGTDIDEIAKQYNLHSAIIQKVGNSSGVGKTIDEYKSNQTPVSVASTFKLVIADTLLRQRGIDLSKKVTVTPDVDYGVGDVVAAGSKVTLGSALRQTLKRSSNNGANLMIKEMGGLSEFERKAKAAGYRATDAQSYYKDSSTKTNKSTISDQAEAMAHIVSSSGSGYDIAKEALGWAAVHNDYYGIVDNDFNKWGGTSKVASNASGYRTKNGDYIIGLYKEGNYTDAGVKKAVKEATEKLASLVDGTNVATNSSSSESSAEQPVVCCVSPGGSGVSTTSVSSRVGYGASAKGQKSLQEAVAEAGEAHDMDPNFIAAFYYAENSRTNDSTNNADSASGIPATGDGKWRDPAAPEGEGPAWDAPNTYTAYGPFQFITSTWQAYKPPGANDTSDRLDLKKEAWAAAKYMRAAGDGKPVTTSTSDGELRRKAFAYNHSNTYVSSVINTYKYISRSGSEVFTGGSSSCGDSSGEGDGTIVGDLAWPVPEKYTKSNWIWFTKGHHDYPAADIPVPDKTNIYSMTDGKVLYVANNGDNGGYGTLVTIESDGALFRYQHGTPGSITVKVNDMVKKGQKIMKSGYTGHVVPAGPQGSHLHLSIETGGSNQVQRPERRCPQELFKAMKDSRNPARFNNLPQTGCISGSL